jgi:hypothetical protein
MKIVGSGKYIFYVTKIDKLDNNRSFKTELDNAYFSLEDAIDRIPRASPPVRISMGWEKDEFEVFDEEGDRIGFISWKKVPSDSYLIRQIHTHKYIFRATRPTGWTAEYNNVPFSSLFEAVRTIQYFITVPKLSYYHSDESDSDIYVVSDMEGNLIGTLMEVDDY